MKNIKKTKKLLNISFTIITTIMLICLIYLLKDNRSNITINAIIILILLLCISAYGILIVKKDFVAQKEDKEDKENNNNTKL